MMYKYAVTIILYYPDQKAIERILNNYNLFSKVLVIDNTDSRSDNSNVYNVLASHDSIIYHPMYKNVGMSEALNYAYNWAIENSIDYLLTMDQDTDFLPSEIEKIISLIESDQFAEAAMFTSNWRKIYRHGCGQGHAFSHDQDSEPTISYGPWKYKFDNVMTTFSMTSGTFYNIQAMKKYLPLPNLFIGMVDDDISYEILRDGKFGIMVGTAKLSQRVGSELVEDTFWNKLMHAVIHSPERYYYMGRNSAYLLKKYKNNPYIIKKVKRGRLRILGNIVLCEKQKVRKLKMWLKGTKEIKNGNLKLGKYEG